MHGRSYSVIFENVTVATASGDQDLFALTPADDKPISLLGIYLAQISDVGDAAEEMLRIEIVRGHATVGSGGSAPTPIPMDPNDAAAACTARVNDTTLTSAGTAVVLHADAFNIRAGWVYIPTPDFAPSCTQAQTTIVVRLMAGPADDVVMSGTLYFLEL